MARTTISSIEVEKLKREVMMKIGKDEEVAIRTKAVAQEVQAYWKDIAWPTTGAPGQSVLGPGHPYETGEYRDSIEIARNRSAETGRFVAGWKVFSNHWVANFVEFGTAIDKPGSRSPWGPNTPTPEYAPASRTAHHFRGTAP